eukprot:snap_masked-scaffold_5-processed-gene-20.36-mRNA-1 protein AED:1.00 eAED:1.00 QI:0/0/0/0/1/1/3/0/123
MAQRSRGHLLADSVAIFVHSTTSNTSCTNYYTNPQNYNECNLSLSKSIEALQAGLGGAAFRMLLTYIPKKLKRSLLGYSSSFQELGIKDKKLNQMRSQQGFFVRGSLCHDIVIVIEVFFMMWY